MIYKNHSRGRHGHGQRGPSRPFNKPTIAGQSGALSAMPAKSSSGPAAPQFGKLRLMVMGGLEEVGRNMTVLEYEEDIVIIDMGLQFPEEDMPGIDYIIPDITYLKDKLKKIRGIIITHGHYDHIGAISHLAPELGNPPIYTAALTAGLIKKRHEEYKKAPLDLRVIDPDTDKVKLGAFASLINRVQQIITTAEKFGRKVYLDGRSMNSNIEIAHQLGYVKFQKDTFLEEADLKRLPDNKIVIIGTGAQGEKNAVLNRIANKEHKFLSVREGDAIVFSSSVIPGNERTIQTLKDSFYKQGANVYHYQMMDIHAGGHAKQEDLKLVIRLFNPKFFVPIEANHYMLRIHGQLAESVGVPKENIFIASNGQVIEFYRGNNETLGRLTEERVPTEYVMVDGLGVGDVSNIVLRDRRMMAEDGMFVVIVP